MTLLPFEPPYFERVGLACSYVGHPVIESGAERGDAARFRARARHRRRTTLVLTVLPGSRGGEVRRLMPIFGEALRRLAAAVGPFRVVVPTVATVAEAVAAAVRDWPGEPIVLRGDGRRNTMPSPPAAPRSPPRARSRSNWRWPGLPMVVAYRLNPLTEALLDRVVKVRQVNLVNLILDRALVAEHLAPDCTPERARRGARRADPGRTGSRRAPPGL